MRLQHSVRTSATPAEVWAVLGDPGQWPTIDVSVRAVRGGHGRVASGQRLMAQVRLSPLQFPVDVVEAVRDERLVLLVHTAPGLRERISFDLTAAVTRGSEIRVTVVVEGAFAAAAAVPLWLAAGLTARLLAVRTDREARQARKAA